MNKKNVLYICLVGLILRIFYIVFYNPDLTFADEKRFWEEGLNLIKGNGLTANGEYAHDMPLTGMITGMAALVTKESVISVKMLFAFISAATIYLIACLAYEIYPFRYTPLIAAGISSCYPFFIYYSALILSETLFMFFVVLFFVQLLNNKGKFLPNSIIAGLAHLTRPTLLYFLPIAWLWKIINHKGSVKLIIMTLVFFTITILPWGIRNNIVLGQFHLTTSSTGHVLWEGNNPWNVTGGVAGEFSDSKSYLADIPEGLEELQMDRLKKEKALQFILNDPVNFINMGQKKFFRFWNIWPNSPDYQAMKYKIISLLSFGIILVLSIVAIFVFYKERRRLSLLYLFIIYYSLIHMVTIGSIRYRLPLEPILIALASAAMARIIFQFEINKNNS